MNDKDFIYSDFFDLPLKRDEQDFPEFIKNYLFDYLKLLRQVQGDLAPIIKERLPIITDLVYHLIKATEEYYVGKTAAAYTLFVKATEMIKEFLLIQTIVVVMDEKQERIIKRFSFKGRTSYGKSFSKKQMFIRPFEDRENLPTYRYSVPGLPCLYLSNHILTAWCELGCPDINSLQVSRFEIDKRLKRLFFALNMHTFKNSFHLSRSQGFDKNFLNYITYFPLHAVCTIKVKNITSVFKPEYIFPQFLMQWISDSEIDIVEYMSTQIDYSRYKEKNLLLQFNNLAIPAKSSKEFDVCEILKSRIKVTEPISWQSLNASYPNLQFPEPKEGSLENAGFQKSSRKILPVEIIKGKSITYDKTIFGIMENYLIDHMEADYVS
jgi:hypothetical protein